MTTFLERDIPQLGISIPRASIERLWRMIAHHHGQILNLSQLGASLGVSHTTARAHVELLAWTFMARLLPPLMANTAKRLVKSPRVYLRDSGMLHALLDIETWDDLLGHPVFGHSWAGMVIENVLAHMPGWRGSLHRTAKGAEIDLVLEKGRRRIAVECKASTSPEVTPGFWSALEDVGAQEAWIVAPIEGSYPLRKGAAVASLEACIAGLARAR